MTGAPRTGYRLVLQLPGARRVFASALLGRMSLATVSLALLLSVAHSTSSYAVAGTAVGAFGLTNVLVAPVRARYVDRAGPGRALPRLATGYAGLLCVLSGLTRATGVGSAVLVVVAAVAGTCPPPLGAAMRLFWARLTRGTALLPQAYSLDAVAEELLFVTGPLLVGGFVAVAPPAFALLGSAALSITGTLLMTRWAGPTAASAGPDIAIERTDRPLRRPGFAPLLVALVGVGVVLGTVEIAAPAFAERHGSPAATGVLLAALSLGSAAGGLLYGARTWRRTLSARLFVLLTALTLLSTALLLGRSVLLLAVLLGVLGLFLAPTVVTGYLLSDELTPPPPGPRHPPGSTPRATPARPPPPRSPECSSSGPGRRRPSRSATAFAVGAGLVGTCGLVASASRTLRAHGDPAVAPRLQRPPS